MLLSQRTQALHNALLGSCDTLIAHRFTAPADQEPVNKWLKANVTADIAREVAESLSSLKTGEAWMCAGEAKIFARRQFPRIHTFDNTATPTGDGDVQEVKQAPVDQEKLRAIIGHAVEEAEANDPKKLKAEIERLKRDVEQRRTLASTETIREAENVAFAKGRQEGYAAGVGLMLADVIEAGNNLRAGMATLGIAERALAEAKKLHDVKPPAPRQAAVKHSDRFAVLSKLASSGHGEPLPKSERLILTALAQYQQGRTKVQVAVLTGYAVNGGGFSNAIGSLRTAGRIEGGSERLTITQAGLEALGPFEALPHGAALLEHWYRQLGKAEKKALEALVEVHPRTLSKAQIAARAGYEVDGGGFNNALGRLRSLELISGRAEIKASEELFG